MKAVDEAGYTTVTGDALVDHLARGAKLPRKPILLTFDDASAGQYTRALPVLREHHFVATFFVMTVVLGKPGWLTRGQVRALDRAGMTIAGHTYDHKAVPDVRRRGLERRSWSSRAASCGGSSGTRSGSSPIPFGAYSAEAIQHLFDRGLPGRVPARRQARPQAPAVEHPPDHRAGDQRQGPPARDPRDF